MHVLYIVLENCLQKQKLHLQNSPVLQQLLGTALRGASPIAHGPFSPSRLVWVPWARSSAVRTYWLLPHLPQALNSHIPPLTIPLTQSKSISLLNISLPSLHAQSPLILLVYCISLLLIPSRPLTLPSLLPKWPLKHANPIVPLLCSAMVLQDTM